MSFEIHFCDKDIWPEYVEVKIPSESEVRTYVPERTCRMETEESCQNWNSCSECHADYYTDQPINYCPNCGAKVVDE